MPAAPAVPPTREEVDVGEDQPIGCLANGLWLARRGQMPYAALLSPKERYGQRSGVRLQIAAPAADAGRAAAALFDALEAAVRQARCYRGKILSLEQDSPYSGQASGLKVHRLPPVGEGELVLPAATRELLRRNVTDFVRRRRGESVAPADVAEAAAEMAAPGGEFGTRLLGGPAALPA